MAYRDADLVIRYILVVKLGYKIFRLPHAYINNLVNSNTAQDKQKGISESCPVVSAVINFGGRLRGE